ncbi:MAG: hypothetical protein AAGN66_00485 [Acidobacteriota bacterium]
MTPKPEIVDHLDPVEFVRLRPDSEVSPLDRDILVFTIHDGDKVPRNLWGDRSEDVVSRPDVRHTYVHERDWGANLVAEEMVRALGLSGYLRVDLARVVLDFGRFPGTSAVGEAYLTRHALYPPVEHLLSPEAIHELLAHYYDGISQAITRHFSTKRITLAVHTYDSLNATGTERPGISLISRSLEYQNHSTIPRYTFDPLFPPILCEATADRALTYQILLDLEKAGHHTALNYPYVMPEGSVEIRAQVWFFYRHLRQSFLAQHPDAAERPEMQRLWQMLLDVTHREADCERLRGFLHQYRSAPRGQEKLFADARLAYQQVSDFLEANRQELVETYRYSPRRPSCLGIEVRKDLLATLDEDRGVVEPKPDAVPLAREVSEIFADSVRAYVEGKNQRAQQLESSRLSVPSPPQPSVADC